MTFPRDRVEAPSVAWAVAQNDRPDEWTEKDKRAFLTWRGDVSSACREPDGAAFAPKQQALLSPWGLDLETLHEPVSPPDADRITSECNVARILRIVTFH